MGTVMAKERLDVARQEIAAKVRELRKNRRWTQAELARRLELSQNRLSEIERGAGSFTAEQFLVILKLFNVPLAHFARGTEHRHDDAMLQNALARLGAFHLQESDDVLPSERLEDATDVVREALVAATPRLLTALGPVLVRNADGLNLRKLDARLTDAGLERRLGWLVDNVLDALGRELEQAPPRPWAQLYRRAVVVLSTFLQPATSRQARSSHSDLVTPDILDAQIRSKKTLEEVRASASPISQRWGIVTSLQPEDFSLALRAARVDD